jgi:hypothetical protein
LLHRSMQAIPADFLDPAAPHLNKIYLIVHAVDGLRSGAYVLEPEKWSIEMIKAGEFRR